VLRLEEVRRKREERCERLQQRQQPVPGVLRAADVGREPQDHRHPEGGRQPVPGAHARMIQAMQSALTLCYLTSTSLQSEAIGGKARENTRQETARLGRVAMAARPPDRDRSSLRWRISTISGGRTRLPTWVVRMRRLLCFTGLSPHASLRRSRWRVDCPAGDGECQMSRWSVTALVRLRSEQLVTNWSPIRV